MYQQILVTFRDLNFHENSPVAAHSDTCQQTGTRTL